MEPVHITVDYSAADYVRALGYVNRRNRLYRYAPQIAVALVFLSLLAFLLILRQPGDEGSLMLYLLTAILPALVVGAVAFGASRIVDPWLLRRSVNKQIESAPMLQERNEITFDETGLSGSTYLGGGTTKWAGFIEVVETDTDFHFFTSPKFTYFVPKSAFESEEDIERLRHLVTERLGAKARLL